MRSLVASVVLVVAGAVLVLAGDGSVGGIHVNTFGAALILVGLIVALVGLAAWAHRDGFAGQRRDDKTVVRR